MKNTNVDSVQFFVIKDWAGNLMLDFKNYGVFASSEMATDYLIDMYPDDDDLGEYQVLELTDSDAIDIDRAMHLDRIDREHASDEKRMLSGY